MSRAETLYVVEIEGIPARYWYGGLPDYATSDDYQGLAEPPTGSGSMWEPANPSVSTPTRRLQFRDEDEKGSAVGPVRWYRTTVIATDELDGAVSDSATSFVGQRTNTAAGRAVGDYLWIGTELVKVSTATGSSKTFVAVRAQWSSTAVEHADGADVYDAVPAWFGREVEIREVDADAASSASEVVIFSGWCVGKPASGIHSVTLPVRGALDWELGNPVEAVVIAGFTPEDELALLNVVRMTDGTLFATAHQDGGYWWVDDFDSLYAIENKGDRDQPFATQSEIDNPVYQRDSPAPTLEALTATQVVYSDADLDYCPFGWYESSTNTIDDHPATIILNLALSTEAGGNDASRDRSFDRGDSTGTGLYQWSLELDASTRIDWDAWEEFRLRTPGVRAQRLYLGLPNERDKWADIVSSLLTPLGWAAVWLANGQLSVARLTDSYPGDTVVQLRHFVRPDDWQHEAIERPTDELVLGLDPTPTGEARHHATVREAELSNLYRQTVGGRIEIQAAPYTLDQWDRDDAPCVGPALEWLALVSQGIAKLTITTDEQHWSSADINTLVDVEDIAVRNPATGIAWQSGDDSLGGMVIGADTDALRRTTRLRIAMTDVGLNTSRWAPGVKRDGNATVNASTVSYPVVEYRFRSSGDSDVKTYDVGDKVRPYDGRRRPIAHGTVRTIAAIPDETTIELEGTDTVEGEWVFLFPAAYDDSVAAQTSRHAYVADDDFGLGSGDADPYQWGV